MMNIPNTEIMLQVFVWEEPDIKVMKRIVAPRLTHLQISSVYTGEERSQIQQIFPNVQVT